MAELLKREGKEKTLLLRFPSPENAPPGEKEPQADTSLSSSPRTPEEEYSNDDWGEKLSDEDHELLVRKNGKNGGKKGPVVARHLDWGPEQTATQIAAHHATLSALSELVDLCQQVQMRAGK